MGESTSLRERTRRAVAAEVTEAAIDLFSRQGFEATTVDQIATAAGLSRRSFFRYFATKEEVLTQRLEATGEHLASALAARPASEAAWTALRRSFDGLIEGVEADSERSASLLRMFLSGPALHGAHLAKQAAWQTLLTDALVKRMTGKAPRETGDGPAVHANARVRLEAAALAGASLACLEAAQVAWLGDEAGNRTKHEPGELAMVLDDAMSSIHPLDP